MIYSFIINAEAFFDEYSQASKLKIFFSKIIEYDVSVESPIPPQITYSKYLKSLLLYISYLD